MPKDSSDFFFLRRLKVALVALFFLLLWRSRGWIWRLPGLLLDLLCGWICAGRLDRRRRGRTDTTSSPAPNLNAKEKS